MARILIVEDDAKIAQLEQLYLEMNSYETNIISQGDEVMVELKKGGYDLILLDVMLPGVNGFELCQQIRKISEIPILFVTARTEAIDVIRGLGFGADDYITKPFDPAQMVARVKANLQRFERLTSLNGEHEVLHQNIKIGDNVVIFPQNWKVYVMEKEVKLPGKEFELLLFLAENPNIVFSRETIFERIWGFNYSSDAATVSVHINRIRDKIEENPKNPKIIETIWGVGYRLNL